MRFRFRSVLALIMSAVIAAGLLAACSGGNDNKKWLEDLQEKNAKYLEIKERIDNKDYPSRKGKDNSDSSGKKTESPKSVTVSVPDKPKVYTQEYECDVCYGWGYRYCTYCGGDGVCEVKVLGDVETYPCLCGNGKITCSACKGERYVKSYYCYPDDSGEKKKVDPAYYDLVWNKYILNEYYAQNISFSTYYDYIYNQVMIDVLSGGSGSNINYDILSGGSGGGTSIEYSYPGTLCKSCNGHKKVECSSCHGKKTLDRIEYAPDYSGSGNNSYVVSSRCDACNGTGEVPCLRCGGKGYY